MNVLLFLELGVGASKLGGEGVNVEQFVNMSGILLQDFHDSGISTKCEHY